MKKCGEKLIIFGHPKLALEVFKKIRMEFMICQCVNEIILQSGYREKSMHSKIAE